jgi:hypothetical protein
LLLPREWGKVSVSTLVSTASTERRRKESCRDFFAELWQLLKSGFKAYTRKRVGHRRTFIWITVVVLMVTYTTMVETRISEWLDGGRNGLNIGF